MKIRWRIKGLLLLVTFAAIFLGIYRVTYQPVNDENAAIRRLVRKWMVSMNQERSGERLGGWFNWPEFLDPKRCTGVTLQKVRARKMPAALDPIKSFKKLKTLTVNLTPEVGLEPIKSLPNLTVLRLAGVTSTDKLLSLAHCPELKELNLSDLACADGLFDQLPHLPKLKKIRLGEDCIDVGTYEQLESNGIEISHSGIAGTFRQQDYLKRGNTFAGLDTGKSKLVARLHHAEAKMQLQIDAISTDKFIPLPAESGWHFLSTQFQIDRRWTDLAGFSAKVVEDLQDSEGYIYDGMFTGFPSALVKIMSVNGYRVHVVWKCQPDFGGPLTLNATIPLQEVVVTVSYDEIAPRKVAEQVLGKFLPIADFEISQELPTGRTTDKKFVFTRIHSG